MPSVPPVPPVPPIRHKTENRKDKSNSITRENDVPVAGANAEHEVPASAIDAKIAMMEEKRNMLTSAELDILIYVAVYYCCCFLSSVSSLETNSSIYWLFTEFHRFSHTTYNNNR